MSNGQHTVELLAGNFGNGDTIKLNINLLMSCGHRRRLLIYPYNNYLAVQYC
jgi:hypothetical protein